MTPIWKILNSPLVVVVIALALWPLLSALSAQYAWRNVVGAISGDVSSAYSGLKDTQRKNDQAKMTALAALKITGAKLVPAAYKGRQKVIGTLHNTGKRTVKQVKVTLSFFTTDGTLMDVNTSWLSNIAFIKPGEKANFQARRSYDRKSGTPAARVSVRVTALSVVEDVK